MIGTFFAIIERLQLKIAWEEKSYDEILRQESCGCFCPQFQNHVNQNKSILNRSYFLPQIVSAGFKVGLSSCL